MPTPAFIGRQLCRLRGKELLGAKSCQLFSRPLKTQPDLNHLTENIHQQLENWCHNDNLFKVSKYYFDGAGKAIRPHITLTMAYAMNYHLFGEAVVVNGGLFEKQKTVSLIGEMYHTASLLHDDVIDGAETRRGKMSANSKWDQNQAILAGDFVMATSIKMLADIGHQKVTDSMLGTLEDLVIGEFQQMNPPKDKHERFEKYLKKTYNKTASLMSNAAYAVTVLAESQSGQIDTQPLSNLARAYGTNLGMAFQLIDDKLDFTAGHEQLGKPAGADMKLGLATAPVLFACETSEELDSMVKRKFSRLGDVERAHGIVLASDGLERTHSLALQYCQAAIKNLDPVSKSIFKQKLIDIAEEATKRLK